MSPSKKAYLDAVKSTQHMGEMALAIRALHTQGLAQEIVDNLALAPEEHIPTEKEGGVPEDLAKAVGELMLEDAKARREALVALRGALCAIPGQQYRGVIADLSDRIQAQDRVLGEVRITVATNRAPSGGGGGGTSPNKGHGQGGGGSWQAWQMRVV